MKLDKILKMNFENTTLASFCIKVKDGGAGGKESACQCRRRRGHGSDPWVGNIPWNTKWQPTQILLPGKSNEQRSLAGYSPWDRKELDMTEHTTLKMSIRISLKVL